VKIPQIPFAGGRIAMLKVIGILSGALPATVNKNVWQSEHDAGFDPIRQVATKPVQNG
jgi:hypothetical protein